MPYRQALRFTDTGPVNTREVAEVCNGINDATRAAIEDLESGGAMDLAGLRPGADITGTFQDVTGYTVESLPGRNVAFTLATGQFAIQRSGRWRVDFTFNITFTPSAAVRTTQLRVFNVTDSAVVGNPIPMIVEANDTGLDRMRFAMFELPAADVGDSLVMQIGGASTFTGVTWFDHTLALRRA